MLGYLQNGIARPLVRLWLASSQNSWRQLPTPPRVSVVHAPGADPDSVLLVGSGIAVGYGVLSHDLALGGHLARALSVGTGRGTDVDIITAPEMSAAIAHAAVAALQLTRFDAIVLTLGGPESLYLAPRRAWRRQLGELLDAIRAGAPSVEVFVVTIPPPPLLVAIPRYFGKLASRHGSQLNHDARVLVNARPGTHVVPFRPSPGDIAAMASRQIYDEWASLIAPAMIGPLNAQAPSVPENIDEEARQRAFDALLVHPARDERFDRIVETARDLFAVSGASVNLIDGDRQWVKAAAGVPRRDLPRSESLCSITIRGAGLFVVEDLWSDTRFASNSWKRGAVAPRFYAGYPVTAPDGHRIGALCVIDTQPRAFGDTEAALLRELALQVQALIWEDARVGNMANS
ncbi:MAG: hypothetical protein JWN36_2572 [Microbacteriaceae bacterium]|nr:hypothetical protein [Microbacteriaceae bacterium]